MVCAFLYSFPLRSQMFPYYIFHVNYVNCIFFRQDLRYPWLPLNSVYSKTEFEFLVLLPPTQLCATVCSINFNLLFKTYIYLFYVCTCKGVSVVVRIGSLLPPFFSESFRDRTLVPRFSGKARSTVICWTISLTHKHYFQFKNSFRQLS